MLALLMGDRGSGTLGGSGGGYHKYLLWDPQPYLVDCGVLLYLPCSLLRLDSGCSWALISKPDQTFCQLLVVDASRYAPGA